MSIKAGLLLLLVGGFALVLSDSASGDGAPYGRDAAHDSHPAMNQPERYAWTLFLELNKPAVNGKPEAIWETWATDPETFPTEPDPAKPPEWPGGKSRPKTLRASTQHLLAKKLLEKEHVSVNPSPAPDTPPNTEEVRRNQIGFRYIIGNGLWYTEGLQEAFKSGRQLEFPLGAISVKGKWKRIKKQDMPRYHWNFDADHKLIGLTALHVSSKVLPNWFWATFEHVDNPERGKDLGCFDSFGLEPPNSRDGSISLALAELFKQHEMGPEWQYYRLNGTQTNFVDSTGRPTLLGNSEIEGPQGVMLTSSCMTCHSKAVMDGNGHFLPIQKQKLPAEGDIGSPNPDWFYNSRQSRKMMQLAFTWGFLNASPIKVTSKAP